MSPSKTNGTVIAAITLTNFFALLLFWDLILVAAPKSANMPEEYVIEHEVSKMQAKNSALAFHLDSLKTPFGCQNCTKSEISYCLSKNLIADHCCCDKRHHEQLPYVPHTCYFGTTLCEPILNDCIEYARLRKCCCDGYVIQKWKQQFSSTQKQFNSRNLNILQSFLIICIFLSYQINQIL